MWSVESENMNKQLNEKERVNYFISKNYKNRFKEVCQKHGMIMSVVVENAIKRFVDSRQINTTRFLFLSILL